MVGDFTWAVAQIKEGKKVRRKEWAAIKYIWAGNQSHLNGIELKQNSRNISTIVSDTNETYALSIGYFEATDWEIYEEEDNWNLSNLKREEYVTIQRNNDDGTVQGIEHYSKYIIETLKQKIWDDIVDEKGISIKHDNTDSTTSASTHYTYNDIIFKEKVKEILDKRFGF